MKNQPIFETYHWQGLQLPLFQSAFKDMGVEEISWILEPSAASALTPDPAPHPALCLGGSLQDHAALQEGLQFPAKFYASPIYIFSCKNTGAYLSPKVPLSQSHSSTNNSLSFHFCLAQQNIAKSRYSCFISWNRFFHISWYPILYICLSLISSLKQLNRIILGAAREISSMIFNIGNYITAPFPAGKPVSIWNLLAIDTAQHK